MVKDLLIFYRRNLVRILPFALIVLFSIFGILISDALISSYFDTVDFYTGFYKTSAVIMYSRRSPEIRTVIKENAPILNIYRVNYHFDEIDLLGMPINYPIIGVRKGDLHELMGYYQVKLKEGRIFKRRRNQIILTEQAARNKGKGLGDRFRLKGEGFYKIVGLLEGKKAIGFYPVEIEQLKSMNKLITFKNPLALTANRKFIQKIYQAYQKRYKQWFRYIIFEKYFEDIVTETLNVTKFSLDIGIVLSVVVYSLIALFISLFYFRTRLPEYGLLLSLGLTRLEVMKRALSENLGIVGVSWICGIGLTRIILELLKIWVFLPQGWLLRTFPVRAIPYTIPVPLGMFLAAVSVIGYKLWKLDPVEIIERGH